MGQPQKIGLPAEEDLTRLEKQRSWVRDHYSPEAIQKFETIEGKLHLLDAILAQGWIARDETWKLQSLGIVFGDALAQKLDLQWVVVDDQYGRDPALMVPKTTIILYPLTAISKRVERGEKVDLYDLFRGFCELVEKQKLECAIRD
jgi:hypothetical protein